MNLHDLKNEKKKNQKQHRLSLVKSMNATSQYQ